ncbi:hypothetical protein ABEO75_19195, partial [Paenibacillus macerans]|uniref:hypothetical protein n=1 Tax=Paenibacillus macerans TaxID=44252 RepID=UPI003D2A7045
MFEIIINRFGRREANLTGGMGQDTGKNEETVIFLQPESVCSNVCNVQSLLSGRSRKGLVRLARDQLAVRDRRNH